MQFLTCSFPEQRFFCPRTGEQVIGEDGLNEDATTLAGLWLAYTFDEPTLTDPKLGAAWKKLVDRLQSEGGDPEHKDLERFLREYPSTDHVAFRLKDPSPASEADFTVWLVLDLSRG